MEQTEEATDSVEESVKYEWELCRENVKPVKRGRRVEAVNKALSHVTTNAEKAASEKLDECFLNAKQMKDPLAACLDFCNWFEDSYPTGKQRLFYTLLWKIVHKYIQNGRYAQDERTLKIWEKLADNSLGHGYEIYQHAHQYRCLTECADFYIRWARDLEDCGAISNAREILHKGRLYGALPLNTLVEEEDQLEMREMRRQLNKARTAEEEDSDEWENDENESRQVFTRVSTLDGAAVPVIRLPSIVGEQGSRTMDLPKQQVKSTDFEIFEDEEKSQCNYLEAIYDIHNEVQSSHVERYALKDSNSIKLIPTDDLKMKLTQSFSSITVWDDDKENVDPNQNKVESKNIGGIRKPKLAFKKEFLQVAMEEIMAERYIADSGIRKRLNFDEE